jgi:hypothetical protein
MHLINDHSQQVLTDQRDAILLDWLSTTGRSGWR